MIRPSSIQYAPGAHALWEHHVRPRLSVHDVFGELPGARRVGAKLRAPCPLHGGRHLTFSVDPATLAWFCHSKCQAGGGPLDFVHRARGGEGPVRGAVFAALVNELAERIGAGSPSPSWEPARSLAPPATVAGTDDAAEVWARAEPLSSDGDVVRWLENGRGLDAQVVELSDLARVLPAGVDVPLWAGCDRRGSFVPWPRAGYRVIVPLFDARGALRSLRFRKPAPGGKARPAVGVTTAGLVMADGIARVVLETGEVPPWWSAATFSVVVAEGEPDFWCWATEAARRGLAEGCTSFPATLGVVSGSFNEALARRLPRRTNVISAVDHDEGGERIHARLAAHVNAAGRDLCLRRWKP
ncbi:MAG: hypothetical protein RL385_1340 [Pseudomonadota bacterium]